MQFLTYPAIQLMTRYSEKDKWQCWIAEIFYKTGSQIFTTHLAGSQSNHRFIILISISNCLLSGSDFYVCDFKGHCVAVFTENGTFQHRIGHEKITCFPNGIDISDAGDILIGDSHGNRFHVACFSRDGVLQSEFECPYVKVIIVGRCFLFIYLFICRITHFIRFA